MTLLVFFEELLAQVADVLLGAALLGPQSLKPTGRILQDRFMVKSLAFVVSDGFVNSSRKIACET